MNILVFANFPPYVLGGAENQVARLACAWSKRGHHVEIAGHRIPNGQTIRNGYRFNLHQIRIFKNFGRGLRGASYFFSVLCLLLKVRKKFDIIYCRGLGDAAISVCIAKMLKITSISVIACPISARENGDAAFIRSIPGWKLLVKLINRHCNAVNIIAPGIVDDLKNLGIQTAYTSHIPNGIPIIKTLPQGKCSPKNVKPRKLIFTGRMCRQKGLDLLIRSLTRLHREGYVFACDILGGGPLERSLCLSIHDHGLAHCVKLKGIIPMDEIRSRLVDYDVFVLPSLYEGMSNSALEALEAGLPVLLTRCGGIDSYISVKTGWVCEPGNQEDLTEKLRLVLELPQTELNQMGTQARELVKTRFDISRTALENIELFKQILRFPTPMTKIEKLY